MCSNSGYPQLTTEQMSQLLSSIQQSQPGLLQQVPQINSMTALPSPGMAPAGRSSMPLQQTLVDRSFCAQSRQTGPASSKDDSKQRKSSRQYTHREVAAIAAAWVEYKPVREGNCKSAPDKKKAWQMFQQKAYELEPSLLPDFSQLSQLKSKVTSITAQYQKAIESMGKSGGAGAEFRETPAFKILEESHLSQDPLVRPQALLDRTRPAGKVLVCSADAADTVWRVCSSSKPRDKQLRLRPVSKVCSIWHSKWHLAWCR